MIHCCTAPGFRLNPIIPPFVCVAVNRLLDGEIKGNLAEGSDRSSLNTEFTFRQLLLGFIVGLLQVYHLTQVKRQVATIVHSIVREHPWQHSSHTTDTRSSYLHGLPAQTGEERLTMSM